jgi:hypothetical protein
MTGTENRQPNNDIGLIICPGCSRALDLEYHADLVCDEQVWCLDCRQYPPELTAKRGFAELQDWTAAICAAFDHVPVSLMENLEANSNWRLYWHDDKCLLAAAYHDQRAILLYPPGQRLTTLCHELAHIFTRQDHTPSWAESFALLIAWVKKNLGTEIPGFSS